jgi:hypothetical protein
VEEIKEILDRISMKKELDLANSSSFRLRNRPKGGMSPGRREKAPPRPDRKRFVLTPGMTIKEMLNESIIMTRPELLPGHELIYGTKESGNSGKSAKSAKSSKKREKREDGESSGNTTMIGDESPSSLRPGLPGTGGARLRSLAAAAGADPPGFFAGRPGGFRGIFSGPDGFHRPSFRLGPDRPFPGFFGLFQVPLVFSFPLGFRCPRLSDAQSGAPAAPGRAGSGSGRSIL